MDIQIVGDIATDNDEFDMYSREQAFEELVSRTINNDIDEKEIVDDFNKHIIEDCDIVERKSKAFRRSIHDSLKTQNSIRRNTEKQIEHEREALLHDLLQERKKKEKEENELIRDRHGFDDHSFKNW